ncbi:DJ-1 family glyoxalase III [Helicobacter sp. MIT 05-5294]|uniref:DJ-1 family glyoxalase III n=1 Tax=Helicobacter sp. MIT 05-5294 TaxID=1548150 RepID=UPI00051FB5D6|nr:DJ-1 family glyoxalase III [Helicobacter sp. MIT 05-5294]TLD86732.1 DJ-1 family protein [Helicobacter sp. MIT 05-5294]
MATRVLIPLAKGFEEIEAICVIDVLRRVGCEVILAAVDKESQESLVVESQSGVKIVADLKISEIQANNLDGVVLPGGWEGTQNLIASTALHAILSELNEKERICAAICAAPLALFKHKILTNQNFTCYPSIEKEIDNPHYKADSNVVQDGNLITSRGPATALEFAFFLARVFAGEQKSQEVQTGMLSV